MNELERIAFYRTYFNEKPDDTVCLDKCQEALNIWELRAIEKKEVTQWEK